MADLVSFGAFELDLRARELRRHGLKLRLPEQSIQVLAMLLERPGEVVLREEIQKKLWPNDTVVEFDHSINAAVKRLRGALGDEAETPRFVETLPRRGYRFIYPLDGVAPVPALQRRPVSPPEPAVGMSPTPIDGAGADLPRGSAQDAADLIGKNVSHYRVLGVAGTGGMGVVYRAEDVRLGRPVALKFLPDELTDNPQALERFEREARAASSLNHPNICTIYEVEEHEGKPFIVMELLEGRTLRECLGGAGLAHAPAARLETVGPFATGELLDLGIQIADGLESAHQKGIIHRDVKPANIFITTRRQAKILDFGLAKLMDGVHRDFTAAIAARLPLADHDTSTAAIDREHLTREGAMMGTAAYMSPEQIRGESLDSRTDLFSLGLVLYEMATGRQAFDGTTTAAIHEAILNRTPVPITRSNPGLPPKIEEIISKALEKSPDLRYQHASDIRTDLNRLKRDTDSGRPSLNAGLTPSDGAAPVATGHSREAPLRGWRFATGAVALTIVGALAFLFRPTVPMPRVTGSTQVTRDGLEKGQVATDGARIYFSEFSGFSSSLYQISTAGGEPVPIQASISSPMLFDISPDHTELLVGSCAWSQQDCPVWTLPVLGGSPRRVGKTAISGDEGGVIRSSFDAAAWSPSGKDIVYALESSLYRTRADGTESRRVASLAPGTALEWPRWSPDGNRLRFTAHTQNGGSQLFEVSVDGKNLRPLLSGWNNPPDECCGSWTPDGKYFLFGSGKGRTRNIWAMREGTSLFRKVSHEPEQLTNGPTPTENPVPSTDGKKVFVTTAQWRGELVRYDSASREFARYLSGTSVYNQNFSRDGKWLAYVAYPEGTLWRSKIDGTERLQLTFPPLFVNLPRWSPDGTRIAFSGAHDRHVDVYVIAAEGGSPERPVPEDRDTVDPTWSPDGNSLLFGRYGPFEPPGVGPTNIEIVDLRTHAISKIPGSEGFDSPRWSQDGRHILANRVNRLMLFDAETKNWTELAKLETAWPEWSRNGDYIYTDGMLPTGQYRGIFRIRISDRKLEQIVSLKDFRQPTNWWGSWVGLAPDDSPLLLRDTSTRDIYALDVDFP